MRTLHRFTLAALTIGLSASALAAPPATAGVGAPADAAVSGCPTEGASQVFARWGDYLHYVLIPNGALETRPRNWGLTGAADVVRGNEPYHVHSSRDAHSLLLPSGSAATTPRVCVAIDSSVLRFFARRLAGPSTASLRVEVRYDDALSIERTLSIGTVVGTDTWAPSPVLPVVVNNPLLREAGTTEVAFRLVPESGSSWQVDDVYLDPWRMR